MVAQNFSIAAAIIQESSTESSPFLREYAIYEINTILWALLIVVTGVLLKRVAQVFWLWVLGSRLPGPRSSAFFGYSSCIAKAGGRNGFTALLSELHKEYGHVVRLWLGPTQLLVSIKDDSLVEEVLLRARDRLPTTGKALHIAYGRSTVFSASFTEAHNKQRLAFSDLNVKVVGGVEAICQKVTEQLKNNESIGSNGAEIDCKSLAQHLAVSVLGATLFGESFLSWPAMDEFKQLLLLIANEACLWANFSIMPLWDKKFQMYRKKCLKLQQLTEDIIAQCRQQLPPCAPKCPSLAHSKTVPETSISQKLTGCRRTEVNLSEEMISGLTRFSDWFGPSKSVEDFRGSLISMMFHGSLSTAGVLSGALTWLAKYSSVQAKVHAEIDKICSENQPPTVDDIKNMHYLMATVHETARLLPSGPLLQRCSRLQDLRLSQGLTVPAGAILAIPVQLIQTDKCKWGADADLFNPERFLRRNPCVEDKNSSSSEKRPSRNEHTWQSVVDTSEGVAKGETKSIGGEGVDGMDMNDQLVFKDPSSSSSFLLFGAGSRSCIGRTFAIIEMMMLLATLLQEFKVKLGSGGENMEPKIENCILHLSPSPKLIFEPRQCH